MKIRIEIINMKMMKTTNVCKQNPVFNGYRIESELEDVLQSGYHKPPLGYDNVE